MPQDSSAFQERLDEPSLLSRFTDQEDPPDRITLDELDRMNVYGDGGRRGREAPTGPFSRTLDFFLRGNYASAKFFDELLWSDSGASLGRAFAGAFKELISPEERLTFSDLIKTHNPDFAARNSGLTTALGFIGDVALDPTTYLTFGAVAAGRTVAVAGGKLATKGRSLQFIGRSKDEAGNVISTYNVRLNREGNKFLKETTEHVRNAGFTTEQIPDVVNKRLAQVLGNPEKAAALLDPGGIKFAGKPLVRGETLDKFLTNIGFKRLVEIGASIPPVHKLNNLMRSLFRMHAKETSVVDPTNLRKLGDFKGLGIETAEKVGKKFPSLQRLATTSEDRIQKIAKVGKKEAELAKEWAGNRLAAMRSGVERAHHLEAENLRIAERAKLEAEYIITNARSGKKEGFSGDSLQRMARIADRIQHRTATRKEALLEEGLEMTNKIAGGIRSGVIQAARRAGELTAQEQSALGRLHETFARLGLQEQAAGLLKDLLPNYFPIRYKPVSAWRELMSFRKKHFGRALNKTFTPGEHRAFKSAQEAAEAGFDPILDIAEVLTLRLIESRQAQAFKLFKEDVISGFGKTLSDAPPEAQQMLSWLGEGVYGAGSDEAVNTMVQIWRNMNSMFRRSATVIRAAFPFRNLMTNLFQAYAEQGFVKGLGSFSSASTKDAFLVVSGQGHRIKHIRDSFGTQIPGTQLVEELAEMGIQRNIALGGARVGLRSQGPSDFARAASKSIQKEFKGASGPVADGAKSLLEGAHHFYNFSGKVEDFSRVALYTNMRRHGFDKFAARDAVNNAFFDYFNGLTAFERKFVRELVPFYTFHRFAVPLVASAAKHAPGRIGNMDKATRTFFEAYSKFTHGDELSDAERNVLPGWLLAQPHMFTRFDEETGEHVFRTFMNFTLFDTFNFLRVDDKGEFDAKGTLEAGLLAQLTPIIKVPLEWAVDKNLFTQAPIRDTRRLGGGIDADKFFRNIVAVAGMHGGTGVAVGAGAVADVANRLLGIGEPALKAAIGWEEGIDSRTGERQVYISPFLLHALTSFSPSLQQAVRLSDDDQTVWERTSTFLFGPNIQRLDLTDERRKRFEEANRKKNQLVSNYRRALRENRPSAAEQAEADLREFLQMLADEASTQARGEIRRVAEDVDKAGVL